jgi:hypothetical protein
VVAAWRLVGVGVARDGSPVGGWGPERGAVGGVGAIGELCLVELGEDALGVAQRHVGHVQRVDLAGAQEPVLAEALEYLGGDRGQEADTIRPGAHASPRVEHICGRASLPSPGRRSQDGLAGARCGLRPSAPLWDAAAVVGSGGRLAVMAQGEVVLARAGSRGGWCAVTAPSLGGQPGNRTSSRHPLRSPSRGSVTICLLVT